MRVPFLQSKRVWTKLLACRFCFPVPAKEYHSVRVCSADHGHLSLAVIRGNAPFAIAAPLRFPTSSPSNR